jgi:hypothetical protein
MAIYSNLPPSTLPVNSTIQAFDNYYSQPLELDAGTYTAMVGFFTGRGFDKTAADNIAVIILRQSKLDGFNPMKVLDTIRTLNSVEISALVSEIINYNRFKTSFLGYALNFVPDNGVTRNIESQSWNPYVSDPLILTDEHGFPILDEAGGTLDGD